MRLSGWGCYPSAEMWVRRAERLLDLQAPQGSLLARGLGRSYGDAALNGEGEVLLMERLARFLSFDEEAGVVRVEAGLSIAELLEVVLPRGWFLPVTPGTKFVTLGGCVACDVHGKNHHSEGSFGDHVVGLELLLADGHRYRCSPTERSDLFWATVGGLGLTGVITEVTLRLKRVSSAYVFVRRRVSRSLEELFRLLDDEACDDLYSVAWIDGLAKGAALGRGFVLTGHHAKEGAEKDPFRISRRASLAIPGSLPFQLLSPSMIRIFNAWAFRSHTRRREECLVDYDRFFYPLDALKDWNHLYGKSGFLQYQVVFPLETGFSGVKAFLESLSASGHPPYLAVLKRFGPEGRGLLSFPRSGYTLALDLPYAPPLLPLLSKLDERLVADGGRIYLAKDARLEGRHLEVMYPRLSRWLAIKRSVDPHNLFRSDLWRRVLGRSS